jgi:hypothetical protein
MKTDRELMNEAQGIKVDVDFQVLIENNKSTVVQRLPVTKILLFLSSYE